MGLAGQGPSGLVYAGESKAKTPDSSRRALNGNSGGIMAVKPVPDGYNTVTPYLTLSNPGAVIDFLKRAFGAHETFAMRDEHGTVRHAEVKVGNSMLMLGAAHDQYTPRPGNFYLYVDDCDAAYKKALAAGGKSLSEPANQFYGDRHGGVTDSE